MSKPDTLASCPTSATAEPRDLETLLSPLPLQNISKRTPSSRIKHMQGLSMAVDLALGPGHGASDSQDALPTSPVHKPGPPRVPATWHLVQFSGPPMKSAFAASLDFHSLDRAFLSPRKVPRSGLQWGRRRGRPRPPWYFPCSWEPKAHGSGATAQVPSEWPSPVPALPVTEGKALPATLWPAAPQRPVPALAVSGSGVILSQHRFGWQGPSA